MVTKSKAAHVDRARPQVRQATKTDTDKVKATQALQASMAASPDWAQASDVQGASQALGTHAAEMSANADAIRALLDQAKALEDKQRVSRRNWQSALRHLKSTVEVLCKGSGDMVKGFGFEVQSRAIRGPLAAPSGLALSKGVNNGEVRAEWLRGSARHGFVVQHATDPANQATYSVPVSSTRSRCTLGGLPPATLVYVRLAAVDPNAPDARSPWSDWATETAR